MENDRLLTLKTRPVEACFPITAKPGDTGDRWKTVHRGYDFGAWRDYRGTVLRPILGANVLSVLPGKVEIAGYHKIYDNDADTWEDGPLGNRIWISHVHADLGLIRFGYCHLKEIQVREGDKVEERQVIGTAGNTGNSSGPHLHFQPETWPGRQLLKVQFPDTTDYGVA